MTEEQPHHIEGLPISSAGHWVQDLIIEIRQLQEAAENYWEAWQDAAHYWKEKVARLEGALDDALGLAELDSEEKEEGRLRSALRTYGQHKGNCRKWMFPGICSCTCGFDKAMGE